MKYAFIKQHRRLWPVSVQCRVLLVSAAGYHAHLARRAVGAQRRHLSDEALLVDNGQSIAAVARTLGVVAQALFNWLKAHRQGKLTGADSKAPVSAEQMEISRLRAELARVKMERDILGKATAYFARGSI